jgi:hypothetical protein
MHVITFKAKSGSPYRSRVRRISDGRAKLLLSRRSPKDFAKNVANRTSVEVRNQSTTALCRLGKPTKRQVQKCLRRTSSVLGNLRSHQAQYRIQNTENSELRTPNPFMSANQRQEEDLLKFGHEKQPWTEAWEQAWEAYQAQQKPGGDQELASLRNRAKQENDARYLGPEYARVFQYLPKAHRPKAPELK